VHASGRPPQRSLGGAARRENAREAYRLGPELVRGYCIVLVDDVVTTGATLRAAAATILDGGAASVRFAVLACADEEILSTCRTKTDSTGMNVTDSG
jgi:predicted amidophosphoribosyltransferase